MVAYANESLQAVKHFNAGTEAEYCTYAGPCAIGVSLTLERRKAWDHGDGFGSSSIFNVIEDGRAVGDRNALDMMQMAHDRFARDPSNEETHFDFLIITTFYAMGLDQ